MHFDSSVVAAIRTNRTGHYWPSICVLRGSPPNVTKRKKKKKITSLSRNKNNKIKSNPTVEPPKRSVFNLIERPIARVEVKYRIECRQCTTACRLKQFCHQVFFNNNFIKQVDAFRHHDHDLS